MTGPGTYIGFVTSFDAVLGTSISTLVYFVVTDGTVTLEGGPAALIYEHGETVAKQVDTVVRDAVRGRKHTWLDDGEVYGWLQATNGYETLEFERRGLKVTHKMFTAEDPGLNEGDKIITADGREMMVRGPVNQAGLDRCWRTNLEEQL